MCATSELADRAAPTGEAPSARATAYPTMKRIAGAGRLDAENGGGREVRHVPVDPDVLPARAERDQDLTDTQGFRRGASELAARDDPRLLLRELEHRERSQDGPVEAVVLLEGAEARASHEPLTVE